MLMLVEHWTPMCFLKGLDTIEGWPDEDEDVICKPFAGSESLSLMKDLNCKKVLFLLIFFLKTHLCVKSNFKNI